MRLFNLKSSLAVLAFGVGLIATNSVFAAEAYTATDLNVRTGPGTHYDRIAMFPPDTGVDVIDSQNDWCLVRGRGVRGWVSCTYLARGEQSNNVMSCVRKSISAPGIITARITGAPIGRTGHGRRIAHARRRRNAGSRRASPARGKPSICIHQRLLRHHQPADEFVHVPVDGAFERIDAQDRWLGARFEKRPETLPVDLTERTVGDLGENPEKQADRFRP